MTPIFLTLANGDRYHYSFPGTEAEAEEYYQTHHFMTPHPGNRVKSICFEEAGYTIYYCKPHKRCIFCEKNPAGGIVHRDKSICPSCLSEINSR